MYTSSNPVFSSNNDSFNETYGTTKENVATIQGVVNKTAILVLIAVIGGALAYAYIPVTPSVLLISCLASFGVCIGVGIMLCRNPKASPIMAPIYAVVEGAFLGIFTSVLDGWLAKIESAGALASGAAAEGARVSLAMPAFLITVSIMLAMLGLYSARILQPTERFRAVLGTLVLGAMITYALYFVLIMFGMSIPFLRVSSATGSGMTPYIGLGISVLFLGIASFCLIVDFGRAEEIVKTGQPKYMEWYAGFGLIVTLAWVYFESVKLVFRLYAMFGRD